MTLLVEIVIQVFPVRIFFFDGVHLHLSRPSLHRFLTTNGFMNIFMLFKIDQTIDLIFFGESWNHLVLMFPYALGKIRCHSDVESAVTFGSKGVNEVGRHTANESAANSRAR